MDRVDAHIEREQAFYICDNCGQDFTEDTKYGVCPVCSAALEAAAANDPALAAALEAQMTEDV